MDNLFKSLAPASINESVEVVAQWQDARIERIVSHGHTSPEGFWYDQDEDEWVMVLCGEATLAFDDSTRCKLRPGDHLFIAAHRRHRVEHTSLTEPTIWLAVFKRPDQ